tara:strand:- start:3746 stop:3907 length:162 start_codon:yes stop_codon:yes gene_type:complete
MREIIIDTLENLREISSIDTEDKAKLDQSIKNLEFILSEYKRLIEEFIEKSSN